jgi:hypothetical protein
MRKGSRPLAATAPTIDRRSPALKPRGVDAELLQDSPLEPMGVNEKASELSGSEWSMFHSNKTDHNSFDVFCQTAFNVKSLSDRGIIISKSFLMKR